MIEKSILSALRFFFGLFLRGNMDVTIGNWLVQKASEDDKVIRVRMVANMLEPDKEDQEILPTAFSKATIDEFLKDGIIDWFHKSMTGRTIQEKSESVLGRPIDFKWEGGLPVVYAELTKAHPIVRDSILPHLEAENDVFGASVGGKIKKIKSVFDKKLNKARDKIHEFVWQHLAIAPRSYIVSGGSAVSLIKANDSISVNFSDIGAFCADYDILSNSELIHKALEAGTATDISNMSGYDATRAQSLEGANDDQKIVQRIINGIFKKRIKPSKQGVISYLKSTFNMSDQECQRLHSLFSATVNAEYQKYMKDF